MFRPVVESFVPAEQSCRLLAQEPGPVPPEDSLLAARRQVEQRVPVQRWGVWGA